MVLTILTVLVFTGCFRKVEVEFAVHIPQMQAESCFSLINQTLGGIDGLVSTRPDLVNRILYVKYDSEKLGQKNIELQIAGLGFSANTLPAAPDAQAKLPSECQ